MNIHMNMSYDNLVEAAQINNTIRRVKIHHRVDPSDQVKFMMHQYMIKTLEGIRDSLTAQGLNGLKDDTLNWEQDSSISNSGPGSN